jgi:hypothetical protein
MQHMCITKCFLNGAVRCNPKFISSFYACLPAGFVSGIGLRETSSGQTGHSFRDISLKKHKGWWQEGRGQIIKNKNVTLEHENIDCKYTGYRGL